MDENHFLCFRADLAKLKDKVVNKKPEEIDGIFKQLVECYLELIMGEEMLPDLIQKTYPRKEPCNDNALDNIL